MAAAEPPLGGELAALETGANREAISVVVATGLGQAPDLRCRPGG